MISQEYFKNTKLYSEIIKDKSLDSYVDSAFLPLKNMSSRKKGKYFERIAKEYLLNLGFVISKASSTDNDFIVEGIKVEVKGSFLWEGNKGFKFQQIRTNQNYDVIIFISIFPDKIEFHACSKDSSKKNLEVQDKDGNWIYNQHGGKKNNSGAFYIFGFPNEINWMTKFQSKQEFVNIARGV
jgi:hypothetical protein